MSIISATVNTPKTTFNPLNYLPTLNRVNRNISKIAFPIIALVALSNLPGAAADTFTACMDLCDAAPNGLPRLICQAGCAIVSIFK